MFMNDFEKAYDRVDWNFLLLMTLLELGFPRHIINLIVSCIASSTLSLKGNGEKLDSFPPKRGLQQGDPSLPFCLMHGETFLNDSTKG